MSGAPYTYHRHARRADAMMLIAGIWAFIGSLVWLIDMAWWIAVALLLTTLPALWDIWSDRKAGLDLSAVSLTWFSGRQSGEVPLGSVQSVRLDTRLDLSVRVTLILRSGQKIRLPQDSVPPHKEFEQELQARNIACSRHHFALF